MPRTTASKGKKYHTEGISSPSLRLGDRDDCAFYNDCLTDAAKSTSERATGGSKLLPCVGCKRYKQEVRVVEYWQRRPVEW